MFREHRHHGRARPAQEHARDLNISVSKSSDTEIFSALTKAHDFPAENLIFEQ